MEFLDRTLEMERLQRLVRRPEGGFAVIYGRRRIGKTRLLLEWMGKHDGLYAVADQLTAEIQRRYLAEALAMRFPGFADVRYLDWRGLLARLAKEAAATGWRGPLVLDELPYMVQAAPELPSVLQRFIDHEARESRLVVAVAGSSQRMMQGMVLAADAPLFGRAHEIIEVGPLGPELIPTAFRSKGVTDVVGAYAAWGGVPRYWELAVEEHGSMPDRVDRLVLDPLGPLHREPDRLLIEDLPPAMEVRPVLDAIGSGAHRSSEIAGRMGRPATSLGRPLERLQSLGLVRREVPFGEPEKGTKRSLYRILDPFTRLWFRVVAPNRAMLASATAAGRRALLEKHWPHLVGAAWEDLCRQRLPKLASSPLAELGPWGPAARWWWKNAPEWDLVAESIDSKRLLVGEARWSERAVTREALRQAARQLTRRPLPQLRGAPREIVRALFVPATKESRPEAEGVLVVTGAQLLGVA